MSYSYLETFPPKLPGRDYLYQPFTQQQWNDSSKASPEQMRWFKDARYGMFIHVGLSSYIDQDLSWGVCHTRKAPDFGTGPIADEEWTKWGNELKFEKFDAKRWVEIAKAAGFKYLVVITKHHDGFHMWDTQESDFKITNTPFGRDFVREVVDACHEQNMPVGLYYSQRDWYHPDYMPVDPAKIEPQTSNNWTIKPEFNSPVGDKHKNYLAYQERVVRELCTLYGKIDVFWWDALWWGGMFTAEMWDAERINRIIRELQPGIIINNRCSIPGDFDTPEKRLGAFQNWRPWESCVCLSETWSYSGTAVKSLKDLVGMLTMTICGDGNLMVSWGPQWNGEFATHEVQAIEEMGEWVNSNEQAIFSTQGGPWKPGTWGGSVYRGSTIYLHTIRILDEKLVLPKLEGCEVIKASLFNSDIPIEFFEENEQLTFLIPKQVQLEPSTIIELQINTLAEQLTPIESGETSPFMDICAYGYEFDAQYQVLASSFVTPDAPANSPLPVATKREMAPWVMIDFGQVELLTAIDLEVQESQEERELRILTSADGENWKDWGLIDSNHAQLEVTTYEAGAWVPGHEVRYIKVSAHGQSASSIEVLNFSCFSRK